MGAGMEETTSTAGSIDKFIHQSHELTPLLSENGSAEDWEESLPAGQDLADYRPDPNVAIPLPPPPPRVEQDFGRIPNTLVENRPQTDREDPQAEWGVCGLLNMGNTCYMNAGLQCIRNIPEIASYYLGSSFPVPQVPNSNGEKPEKDIVCKGHLSARFSTLLRKLWCGRFSALHPKAFKLTFGLVHTQFADNRQQDCHEFLAMLLDTLHEDVPLPLNGDCSKEGDESTNQIPDDIESHGPIEVDMKDGSSSSLCAMTSVISETFQGMLRSEVVCNTCNHLSTKTEPFLCLSIPLPHAHERQIEVNWVPVCTEQGTRKVIRLLVTVQKHMTVAEMKGIMLGVVRREESHDRVVMCEVVDRSITRVLADTLPLKRLVDVNNVYAFEMAPLGSTVSVLVPEQDIGNPTSQDAGQSDPTSQDAGTDPTLQGAGQSDPTLQDAGQSDPTLQDAGQSDPSPQEMGYEPLGDSSPMDPWLPVSGRPPPSLSSGEALDLFGSEQFSTGTDHVKAHGGKHGKESSDSEGETLPAKMIKSGEDTPPESLECDSLTAAPPQAMVMEWHSCSICLEEKVDTELLTHKECGAIVCPTCLQTSAEHYSQEGKMPCVICSMMVKPSEAFLPLASHDSNQPVIRLLQTNIMFRRKVTDGSMELFSHPAIMNLPSSENGSAFYAAVAPLLSPTAASLEWNLCLTDAKGRFCSRCLFGTGCRGCVIAQSEVPFDLKPGDHISVTFPWLPDMMARMAGEIELHLSLGERRSNQLSLQECLETFSKRELLGSDNPWFCPTCMENKEAMRTLLVCSLPRTLVIHLKRFVYHGKSGSKVDAAITFPLEVDPSVICREAPCTGPLELSACICHYGSMSCGHYTAYSRHPSTQEWHYYNDETVTKVEPQTHNSESAYILFYQQKVLSPPTLPEVKASFDDTVEMKSVEQLLRLFKVTPTPSNQTLPLKRASSESNLADPTAEKFSSQANSFLSSLGLDSTSLTRNALGLARSSSNPQLAKPSQPYHNELQTYFNNKDMEPDALGGGVKLLSMKMTPW